MVTDTSTSDGAECFLSVRSSCNRCRFQKLKCSVPTGSGACERCTRAKVPCIFGRRTPSKRQLPSDEDDNNLPLARTTSPNIQTAPLSTFSSLPTPTSTTATQCETQCETLPGNTPYIQLAGPIESVPASAPELEPGSSDIRMWDNVTPDLHSVLECGSDTDNYGWTQSGLNVDYLNRIDGGQLELLQLPSQLAGLTATNWSANVTATANNKGSINISTGVLTSQRLIALISEIQQRLRKLEEGPWHANSTHSLDDYPVGTVLQLAQQFEAIASLVLNSTGGVMMPYREEEEGQVHTNEELEDGDADDGCERKVNDAVIDTPTTLLLLSGYIWLVRIFDVAMGHFQKHLDCMPSNNNRSDYCNSSMTAAVGRTLRLGELPYTNAALGLQKIHVAVSMLLDALHNLEEHLGREGKVVRDIAVALLLNDSGRRQNDGYGELGRRATAVKELLRKKMGL